MKQSSKFVKRFDIFSMPFLFSVGDERKKKTLMGGIISMIILGISITYLYYLLNMYFQNNFEPRITSRVVVQTSNQELEVQEGQMVFEFIVKGEPLKQYEKRVGKTYLTFLLTYNQFFPDGTSTSDILPIIECSNERFKGFLCFDDDSIKNRNIILKPLEMYSSNYEIIILPCNSDFEKNCASPEEIYSTIFIPVNYFQIFTKIQQYNPHSLQYEDQFKSEYIYFDPNQFLFSRFSLIKASTVVTSGILIQSSQERQTTFDCQKIDVYFTQIDLYTRYKLKGYGIISYELNQQENLIVVQHPMITEVLAQFSSIFNFLLIFGILAKLLSQSFIVEEINSLLLKTYYKKTATELLKKKNCQSISLQERIRKNQLSSQDTSLKFQEQQDNINKINFSEVKKKFFKFGICDNIKLFFKHLFLQKRSEKEKQSKEYSFIYMKLWEQSYNRINIFELVKDLMKLKMIIKLMLSKEQYAAIHFCGSEILKEESIKINEIIQGEQQNLIKEINIDPEKKEDQQTLPPLTEKSQNLLQNAHEDSFGQLDISENKIGEINLQVKSKQLIPLQILTKSQDQNIELGSTDTHRMQKEKQQNLNGRYSQLSFINNSFSPYCSIPTQNKGDIPVELKESCNLNTYETLKIDSPQLKMAKVKQKKSDFLSLMSSSKNSTPSKNKIEVFTHLKESKLTNNFSHIQNMEQLKELKSMKAKKEYQLNSKKLAFQSFEDGQFQQISHLQEMDLIEESSKMQQYYLAKFLEQDKNEIQKSLIDENILNSLLFFD